MAEIVCGGTRRGIAETFLREANIGLTLGFKIEVLSIFAPVRSAGNT